MIQSNRSQQQRAQADHDEPHHDGAEDAPLEHLRLRLGGNAEVREDQDEDEEVVDAERQLDEVAGVVLQRRAASPPATARTSRRGAPGRPAARSSVIASLNVRTCDRRFSTPRSRTRSATTRTVKPSQTTGSWPPNSAARPPSPRAGRPAPRSAGGC